MKRDPSPFQAQIDQLEAVSSHEEKLRLAINMMRGSLSQEGSPDFRLFWEVRKRALPLFKESLPNALRSEFWEEYTELTREGRRLKDLLDEEAAFAVEQITRAIESIEAQVDELEAGKLKTTSFPDRNDQKLFPEILEERYGEYRKKQQRLSALATFAMRINALRKELVRQEMRIRQKNQLFDRLSKLGDRVFPPRKELILEVSALFQEDVANFLEGYFSGNAPTSKIYFLRDQIKALQAFAKVITINTDVFSSTRLELGKAWDLLKEQQQENKEQFQERREQSKKNRQTLEERVASFAADWSGEISQGKELLNQIEQELRGAFLIREDQAALRKQLEEISRPLVEKEKELQQARAIEERAKEESRKQLVDAWMKELQGLLQAKSELVELQKAEEEFLSRYGQIPWRRLEKEPAQELLKRLKLCIAEKEEEALLSLSAGDRQNLENLQRVANQRKKRRSELKAKIEELRKLSGGSTLDFEEAMRYSELLSEEKEQLKKLDEGIQEVEAEIQTLKRDHQAS